MSVTPPPLYESHSTFLTTLKPYLELPHLLSLTWLAYPVLSLLFVAFRLQLSLSSSQDALSNAKGDILAGCRAAEKAATAAASMPRFMAAATNRQFAEAVNDSMNAARAALVLSLTVMEAIINFIVDTYRSTFLCFVELVVRGGLAILIAAVQELNTFVQNTASGIRTSIQNDVATANSAIQSAVSAINKVNPFGNINVPPFDIPSLTALQNITLPTDFESSLVSLNSSLPSFAELKQKVDDLIDTPFELLKADINDTFSTLSFDSTILPVPSENTISFCDQLDTSIVDDLGRDLLKAAQIATVILVLVALLLIAGNCLLEWYKWNCLMRHLRRTREAWVADPTLYHSGSSKAPQVTLSDHNLLVLRGISAHPLLTRIAYGLESRLRLSPSQHTHLQWFFHYVFHPPALACFLIGFFGLLSVQIQLLAIGPLEAKFNERAESSASDLSSFIVRSVNDSMFNQSSLYANDINSHVDSIQSSINNGLFGWVNGTTTTLNDTVNEFYNDIQSVVSTVFNGTILEAPAQDFVKCIIGSKVDALEEALTFLNQNLRVDMPRVNESVLILSQAQVNEATKPIADAAIGGGHGSGQGLVGRLINSYAESLKKERIMFGVFMLLWIIVVLMAIAIILWHAYGRPWMAARRKRKWEREQRTGISNIVVPFRERYPDGDEKGGRTLDISLPVFTPLPSPATFPLSNQTTLHTPIDPNLNTGRSVRTSERWDSFFDESDGNPANKPRTLRAIGRKAMGKERFVGDEENPREKYSRSEGSGSQEPEKSSWLSRIIAMARRGKGGSDAAGDGTQSKPRISFDFATDTNPGSASASEPSTPKDRSTSTWSISTLAPPASPWTSHVTPTKQLSPTASSSGRKLRPNADIPADVTSVYEAAPIRVQNSAKPPFIAIPVRYGIDTPPLPSPVSPAQYATLAPPPVQRKPLSSEAASASFAHDQTEATTPLTRLLTTMHARRSSSVNPFATPFDDEHRATDRLQAMNPFAAVAV